MSSEKQPTATDMFYGDSDPHTARRESGSKSNTVFLIVNNAPGAPYSIAVRGAVKCLVCYEYIVDKLVCDACRAAVRKVRNGEDLMHSIMDNPTLVKVIEHLGNEAIARYFIDSISTAIGER